MALGFAREALGEPVREEEREGTAGRVRVGVRVGEKGAELDTVGVMPPTVGDKGGERLTEGEASGVFDPPPPPKETETLGVTDAVLV